MSYALCYIIREKLVVEISFLTFRLKPLRQLQWCVGGRPILVKTLIHYIIHSLNTIQIPWLCPACYILKHSTFLLHSRQMRWSHPQVSVESDKMKNVFLIREVTKRHRRQMKNERQETEQLLSR